MGENTWETKTVQIKEIKKLLNSGYEIEISSADGWVKINSFVEKGKYQGYKISYDDTYIITNEFHLFETKNGWKLVKDMDKKEYILHKSETFKCCEVVKLDTLYNIVDVEVDHFNHRYYTNGLSSHNTNVGKTLTKCHFASHYLNIGKNVLYISCEISQEEIAKRIDANLFNLNINEIKSLSKEEYENKIAKLKKKVVGKLIVKEYPPVFASVATFRTLMNELNLKKNFVPDIIIIDYLNICASSRVKLSNSVNSYTYVKAIAEEIRGLAVEYNVPILTSTQFNRSGNSNSDPSIENVSESHGISTTCDWMVALISSDELDSLGQYLVKQIKSRYGDKNFHRKFVIGVDKLKMKLYDLEEAAQQEIVQDVEYKQGMGDKFNKNNFDDFKFE